MPQRGMSIVEEFYLWGMGAMLLNMLGHVLSFRYDRYSVFIDTMSLGFSSIFVFLLLSISFHGRACEKDSFTTPLIVFCVAGLALSATVSVLRNRLRLKKEIQKASVIIASAGLPGNVGADAPTSADGDKDFNA